MNNEDKQKLVEQFLNLLKIKFEKSEIYSDKTFKTFIVAGSYADWLKNKNGLSSPSWKSIPDINLYVIIKGSNKEHLVISSKLINIYREIETELKINLLLDLHPFYKSYSDVEPDKFNLQLTTRIINSNKISSYPDYCWYGWKSNFVEISSKEKSYLENLPISSPIRDREWLKYMYMAFSSYNNAVHMAVLSNMFEKQAEVFDEIYRYLKEISKDGMSLAIPRKENFDYLSIKSWKNKLPLFYEKYYGEKARQIIERLEEYENNYFYCRENISIESIASDFADLLDIIYQKGFFARKKELIPNISDEFLEMPLWY